MGRARVASVVIVAVAVVLGTFGGTSAYLVGRPAGVLVALYEVAACALALAATSLIRRTGRAASPPARTEITRTTGGPVDG